jgi:hypothetical protein
VVCSGSSVPAIWRNLLPPWSKESSLLSESSVPVTNSCSHKIFKIGLRILVSTWQRTQFLPIIKTNRLMLFGEIIAVFL